jgi:hypothetical protein
VVAYVLELHLPEMMQTAEKERQKFYAKVKAACRNQSSCVSVFGTMFSPLHPLLFTASRKRCSLTFLKKNDSSPPFGFFCSF